MTIVFDCFLGFMGKIQAEDKKSRFAFLVISMGTKANGFNFSCTCCSTCILTLLPSFSKLICGSNDRAGVILDLVMLDSPGMRKVKKVCLLFTALFLDIAEPNSTL